MCAAQEALSAKIPLPFASALLGADQIAALATLVEQHAVPELACKEATLLWALDGLSAWSQASPRTLPAEQLTLVQAAATNPSGAEIASHESGLSFAQCVAAGTGHAVLLCTFDSAAGSAAEHRAQGEAFFNLVRPYLRNALEKACLREAVAQLEQSEKLQRALFAIADMASSDLEMPEMLRGLHKIVGDLMYAENFFIALHDAVADTIRFIYFADVADDEKPVPQEQFSMARFEGGLTWYVIRDGKPLIGTHAELTEQASGPLRVRGPSSLDWLGVPMVRGNVVHGALVVQSYVERPRYTGHDQALLSFVGSHILTALERKQAQEELERRVEQRTQELAKANDVLTAEVLEKQRGEKLQKSLFRIAELSNAQGDMQAFYAAIHEIVGELIDATNFYIALVSPDGSELQFPYLVDEKDVQASTVRPFGSGATEYVIRTQRPLLAEMADIETLCASGEITLLGPPPQSWLGVPLVCADSVVGVVTVQSYSPQVRYTSRDQELLTFVSHQIANSLERKRATNALQVAHAELERRVEERTQQLSEQISVRQLAEVALQQRNSELESLNSKLAGTQSQLLQSEKMASVGQLAAGVAHEINNPIGYVRSNLTSLTRYLGDIFSVLLAYEQLENALPAPTPELEAVRAIKRSTELDYVRDDVVNLLNESVEGVTRVEKIVRDLKDFSRADDVEWQQADIHEGINSTLNVVAHELKYKGAVVKEFGELPPIQCLPFQLKQVFMNLLVNAAHAIEQRGTITIRTGRELDSIWITISDTGKGIDPRHLNRIFEPFFTTKPVGVGTGLGLSVSYTIIQKHSGTLEVASEVGKGTTFTIRLPITQTDIAHQ